MKDTIKLLSEFYAEGQTAAADGSLSELAAAVAQDAFEWKEELHPRTAKGGKGGGQFAKKPETERKEDERDLLSPGEGSDDLSSLIEAGKKLVSGLFGENSGIVVRRGNEDDLAAAEDARPFHGVGEEVLGYWDGKKGEVVLFDGATAATVGHEIAWHAVRQWAEENSPELLAKMDEYARESPEAVNALIASVYGNLTGDALLDEIGAGRFEDEMGDRFSALVKEDDESKSWWQRMKDSAMSVWKAGLRKFRGNDIDLSRLADMDADEAMDWMVGQMLEGKRLGEWTERFSPAPPTEDSVLLGGETEVDGDDGKRYSVKSAIVDLDEGKMIEDLSKERVIGKGKNKETLPPVFTKEEAVEFEKSLRSLVKRMEQNPEALDINEIWGREDRPFLPYKDNQDPLYKISLDFSTLCKKRLFCQHVIESLQLKLDRPLSAKEQLRIRDKLIEYQKVEEGLQVACGICYVEAARLKSPEQMAKWLDNPSAALHNYFARKSKEFAPIIEAKKAEYKKSLGLPPDATKDDIKKAVGQKAVDKLNALTKEWRKDYKMTPAERATVERAAQMPRSAFLSAANLTKLLGEEPDIYQAYVDFIRNATHSKALEEDVPYYYGDSRRLSDKFIKQMNEQGTGLRHQSWSDFQVKHLLDSIVAVCDLSVRDAKMHAYTKVPEFARMFGNTGMMMNLSLIPNKDGEGFSPTEGMDYGTAKSLRDQFPDTCGTIAIGTSDAQICKILDDPAIDYVIPYHISGLNKDLRKMVGIVDWKDYTKVQHEKEIKGVKRPKTMPKDDWQRPPDLSEWLTRDEGKPGAEQMERGEEKYLRLCHERGLTPKFAGVEGLLRQNADGSYSPQNRNYWKLLIDHKMVNHKTGALIKQRAVRPDFDFKDIRRVVDDEVRNYDPGLADRALKYIMGSDLGDHLVKGHVGKIESNLGARKKVGKRGLPSADEAVYSDAAVRDYFAAVRDTSH